MAAIDNPYDWPRAPRRQIALPGAADLYALFLRLGSQTPGVSPLAEGLIYIGMSDSRGGLRSRCHFQNKTDRHSPRRSLAALLTEELRLTPLPAANGNFKLRPDCEAVLTAWMHDNLLVAFTP